MTASGHAVAIVGAGPKGLHALERLIAHLPIGAAPTITVFEPATAGAGPAYDPGLDPALLMNLRADAIDAWPRSGAAAVAVDRAHPTYLRWCATAGASADAYPPRRDVGRYLRDAMQQITRDAAGRAELRHRRELVADVQPGPGSSWQLLGPRGAPLGTFDEVLLATGHGPPATGDARWLQGSIADASGVIVARGFGLTTLDLVRLLDAHDAWAAGVRVHALSRSGRPPLAKPQPNVDDRLRDACGDPQELPWPEHGRLTVAWLRAATQQLAAALLHQLSPAPPSDELLTATLADLERRTPIGPATARAWLARSLAIATGQAPPDGAAALGVAWRVLQAGLAQHGSFGGLPTGELPALRRLAGALELIAFGPPLASARTLLAALDAGWVQLRHSGDGAQARLEAAPGTRAIDTVLPAPGVIGGSLIWQLRRRGVLHGVPHGRGVLIDRSGRAITDDGTPVEGLSLIGRPTEDVVLANDTLSRSMHGVAERWGARVAAAARPPSLAGAGAGA